MQKTTLTNVTTLGVSVAVDSLTDSSEAYLKCAGGYYKGSLVSGFNKETSTISIDGVVGEGLLKDVIELAEEEGKTSLTIKTMGGAEVDFGEGKITNFGVQPGTLLGPNTYSLNFETSSTKLDETDSSTEFMVLDPANYKSIEEDYSYDHDVEENIWTLSHNLSVVPNNHKDYVTTKGFGGGGGTNADGKVGLSSAQIAQNYIQEGMEGENPPFPLDGPLEGILEVACSPNTFNQKDCEYVKNYSYSSQVDLICGGVRSSKTVSLRTSGSEGYEATHSLSFDRSNDGSVTLSIDGTITAVTEDRDDNGGIVKSFNEYAEEGYVAERDLVDSRLEFLLTELEVDDSSDFNMVSETKTVSNPQTAGEISYSVSKSNAESEGNVSKNTSVERSYDSPCPGTKVLVTSITQQATVSAAGCGLTPDGENPKAAANEEKFTELMGAAKGEIEALYEGDRPDDFKLKNTSTSNSPYRGSRSYTIEYSDSLSQDNDQGYENESDDHCYSWKTKVGSTPEWGRQIETDTVLGPVVETKGVNRGKKTLTINMREGTGSCSDLVQTYLEKSKEVINDNTTEGSCFLEDVSWNIQKSIQEPAEFTIDATFTQNT